MRESNRVPLAVLRRLGRGVPEGGAVRRRVAARSVPLPARITITDDLLWFLGLYVAEGSWHERENDAFVTLACDDARLDRAEQIVRATFGLHVVRSAATEERAGAIFVHSRLLL